MNHELKQLLQTILRAELEPIRQELQTLKTDVAAIKETMATKEDVADLPLIKRAVDIAELRRIK
ncbi:hypothetical protein [Effusibacillus pohliae]|uniref:hypothetical protein n=1 Tax=Effusibacillus pohliae TaxID=232270 RepID=UPI000374A4D0|nr:hypothetical protein [Effusibacillus pohliae]